MPKYVLTGTDGHLGSVAAEYALEIAGPDDKLVFTSYVLSSIPAETLGRWKSKGAEVVEASYDDVPRLKQVFEGAEAVTLISTWLIGEGRRRQHKNVIDAAKAVGVRRICYTSFVGAGLDVDEAVMPFLPRDHRYTERLIYASGMQYSIQRNYLYIDNIPTLFAPSWKYCGNKWILNSDGQRGAYVAREDCSRVAAALLLGKGEPNTVYEVSGPEAVTDSRVFDFICGSTGYKAEIENVTDEELAKYWTSRGLPDNVYGDFSKLPMKLCLGDLSCCGEVVRTGLMSKVTDTVEKLTGRKPKPVEEVLVKYKDVFPKPE